MADLIETLLTRLSLRSRVFHRGQHCGNWKLDLEQSDKVLFHFVNEGNCVVELPEQQCKIKLAQGDLLLLTKPGKHILHASENTSSDNTSGLICAYVEFDSTVSNPLFEALPDYVIARADGHSSSNWLKYLLSLLFAEAEAERTASHTVIERLTDILFIHIIRCHIINCPELTGILSAYNDSALRTVLELMHFHPQKPWSIADFSVAANLSRSVFIEKFSNTLGVPPMTYLTQQRLEYGYRQLKEGKRKVIDVALDCGYENESSFSKAFKRMYNITPSMLKRSTLGTVSVVLMT